MEEGDTALSSQPDSDPGILTVTAMWCEQSGMSCSQGFHVGHTQTIGSQFLTICSPYSSKWTPDTGMQDSWQGRANRSHHSCTKDRNTWVILPSSITGTSHQGSDTDVCSCEWRDMEPKTEARQKCWMGRAEAALPLMKFYFLTPE
jgi:hypothetical protein